MVSWMPANECVAPSSPRPDERTAKRQPAGRLSNHSCAATAGDRPIAGVGEDDEAVGNRKSGLFQAGAVERLAPGAGRVGVAQAIEGRERFDVAELHPTTLLQRYLNRS